MTMEVNKQLKTLEGTESFLKNLSEECRKNLIAVIESTVQQEKEKHLIFLQQAILAKPYMTEHHRTRLQKKTNQLINNQDAEWLEKINKWIAFSERWWVIFNTPDGQLKFAPHQATYDDVKDIEGIKEYKNILIKNTSTGQEGLWANFDAIKELDKAGKKICTDEQYIAAVYELPWWPQSIESGLLTSVKDFFELLWGEQIGFYYNVDNTWRDGFDGQHLWSSSEDKINRWKMKCNREYGRLGTSNENDFLGIWFLED